MKSLRGTCQIGFVSQLSSASRHYTWQRMRLQPQGASRRSRIGTDLMPPGQFIARAMHLTMVSSTQRNSEFIAHFAAECRRLRKLQVMSIGRTAAADQAWLLGNGFDVVSVANPARRWQCEHSFIYS